LTAEEKRLFFVGGRGKNREKNLFLLRKSY